MPVRQKGPPTLRHFIGICRPEQIKAGHRTQRCDLLDRLMGRPILADANGVVREDVDYGQLHQGAEPECAPKIIAENKKTGAIGPDLYQAHPVEDRGHRMLPDAEVEVATGVILR